MYISHCLVTWWMLRNVPDQSVSRKPNQLLPTTCLMLVSLFRDVFWYVMKLLVSWVDFLASWHSWFVVWVRWQFPNMRDKGGHHNVSTRTSPRPLNQEFGRAWCLCRWPRPPLGRGHGCCRRPFRRWPRGWRPSRTLRSRGSASSPPPPGQDGLHQVLRSKVLFLRLSPRVEDGDIIAREGAQGELPEMMVLLEWMGPARQPRRRPSSSASRKHPFNIQNIIIKNSLNLSSSSSVS